MIKLYSSACIEAPVDVVWAGLAKLEAIQLWSDQVVEAHCIAGREQGVAAERICRLAGNITIREHWLAWEEGKSYTYEGIGLPMMKRATNHWTVYPQGDKTLLTSEATLELRFGWLGRGIEPLFGFWARRMAPNALAGFKYWVEHGHPFTGKRSQLPPVAATC